MSLSLSRDTHLLLTPLGSPYMAQIYEVRPQLMDRMQRLRDLFKCIRKNGLLGRVPQASRRKLSRDAEKAKAAVELWEYQDRLMGYVARVPQDAPKYSPRAATSTDPVPRPFSRTPSESCRSNSGMIAATTMFEAFSACR